MINRKKEPALEMAAMEREKKKDVDNHCAKMVNQLRVCTLYDHGVAVNDSAFTRRQRVISLTRLRRFDTRADNSGSGSGSSGGGSSGGGNVRACSVRRQHHVDDDVDCDAVSL